MKKRILLWILSLVLMLSLGTMSVFATNGDELNSGETINRYEIKLLDKSLI